MRHSETSREGPEGEGDRSGRAGCAARLLHEAAVRRRPWWQKGPRSRFEAVHGTAPAPANQPAGALSWRPECGCSQTRGGQGAHGVPAARRSAEHESDPVGHP
ncbi:hypothetical protein GCM10023220_66490 [Streptomyces ziwulingensis]|uniref:Uncharacterized protein n=1 Tax=Streptomyces ziwulingensis TaxID=1045501 RepID=A0ABP9D3R7_9ACTN